VDAVTNGQAALDAALKLRPDVVVLDISMPVMNGIQEQSAFGRPIQTPELSF